MPDALPEQEVSGRVRQAALALASFVLVTVGCASSGGSSPGGANGGASTVGDASASDTSPAEPAADASTDDGAATSDAGALATLEGCAVKRAPTAKTCDENCGARLTLPAGGSFCTIECAKDSDCAAPLSGLLCPATVGACMPSCTTDASCKAAGFLRCDPQTKACDTL
jgi:hypothetical protein